MNRIFLLTMVIFIACRGKHNHEHSKNENDMQEHKHSQANHENHEHGRANKHMHQSSLDDLVKRFESPERDEYQQPDKVLAYLGDIKDKTIMDIGAGTGYFSVKLADHGAHVIAADVDDDFQDYLKKRIEDNHLTGIETRKIPYDSPGLSHQEVDMVFMVNTYHHIENRVEYFKKVRQGIKNDGSLVIIDFYNIELPVGPPVGHKVGLDVVVNELKEAGFETLDLDVNLLPYQFVIRARK